MLLSVQFIGHELLVGGCCCDRSVFSHCSAAPYSYILHLHSALPLTPGSHSPPMSPVRLTLCLPIPPHPLPGSRRRRQGACRSKQQYDGSQTQQRLDSLIWQSREAAPHRTTILLPRILLRASEGCTSNVCGADVDAVQWSNVSICS